MERKSFLFREEYYDVAHRLPKKKERLLFYEAVCDYALHGIAPDADSLPLRVLVAFGMVKDLLDADARSAPEIRRSTEYKEWRARVFRRDDYTCQRCGARGVKINAHHIKHFATDPDLRLELSNGITLCVTCHKAVHHGA